jgi:hypothetical protein
MPLSGANPDLMICPLDPIQGGKIGGVPSSGRHIGGNWGNYEHLLKREPRPISYLYEVSSSLMKHIENDSGNNLAYDDFVDGWLDSGYAEEDWPADWDSYTWAEYKYLQLTKGMTGGRSYPPSDFPIIRCFHHREWTGSPDDDNVKEVLCVSWDCATVFFSTPYWEADADPARPRP